MARPYSKDPGERVVRAVTEEDLSRRQAVVAGERDRPDVARRRLRWMAYQGRRKTMTLLAALRHDRVTALWLVDGPIDGQSFLQYVAEVLVPTLQPGDIVIIDNLGSHKGKAIRQAQALAAKSRPARRRCRLQRHRRHPAPHFRGRMLKILRGGRICSTSNKIDIASHFLGSCIGSLE